MPVEVERAEAFGRSSQMEVIQMIGVSGNHGKMEGKGAKTCGLNLKIAMEGVLGKKNDMKLTLICILTTVERDGQVTGKEVGGRQGTV
jgi:hypothetical protein